MCEEQRSWNAKQAYHHVKVWETFDMCAVILVLFFYTDFRTARSQLPSRTFAIKTEEGKREKMLLRENTQDNLFILTLFV